MNIGLVLILFIGLYYVQSEAKIVEGTLKLDSLVTEQFIAKFAFSESVVGKIKGSFQPSAGAKVEDGLFIRDLVICTFNDDKWENFQKETREGSLCKERRAHASWSSHVNLRKAEDGSQMFSFMTDVSKPEGVGRTHFLYLVAMACVLEEYDAKPVKLDFNFEFLNGESHLPADEDGMIFLHTIGLIASFIGIGFFIVGLINREKMTGQIHLLNLILGYSIILQAISIMCELAHLIVYSSNGHGLRFRYSWFPLDFFSEVARGASEILISICLICLASGWTLGVDPSNSKSFLNNLLKGFRKPGSLFTSISLSSVFAVSIISVQILLEMAGRSYAEDFASFHDHEHLPGYILIFLRLFLGVIFFLGTTESIGASSSTGHKDMVSFLETFRIIGSAWFITFPIVVLFASFLPPYHRNSFVEGGNILLHLATMAIMLSQTMFGGKYQNVSSIKQMGNLLGPASGKKIAMD